MSTTKHFAGVRKAVDEANKQFIERLGAKTSDRFIHFLFHAEGYKTFGDIDKGATIPDIAMASVKLIVNFDQLSEVQRVNLAAIRREAVDVVRHLHRALNLAELNDEQRKVLSDLSLTA